MFEFFVNPNTITLVVSYTVDRPSENHRVCHPEEPKVPAKAGKDLSFIDPVSILLNGSVLERSFAALRMT